MKRRKTTKQTARKSTRGSSDKTPTTSVQSEEDDEIDREDQQLNMNELNTDSLMTDDETKTDENLTDQNDDQSNDKQTFDQTSDQNTNNQKSTNNQQEDFSSQSEFIVSLDATAETILTESNNNPLNGNQELILSSVQPSSSNQANENVESINDQSSIEETTWISNDSDTVHAFKYKFKIGVTDRAKIAAFDLDGTLITPKSNKKFSRDMNDWKILDGRLKSKISKLIDDGYAFVIFSNQMGVSTKFVTLKQIKYKFRNIIQSINLPCVAMFCTDLDKYRKPSIGMLEFYKTINRTKIDLQNSFFVGDAMGRPKDHSAADLLFAFNCKLPFVPIEGFLSGFEKPKLFTYDQLKKYRIPKFSSANSNNQILPRIIAKGIASGEVSEFCFIEELTRSIESFVENNFKSIVILLIGLFGSGKTFFFDKYLANLNYKSIDYDLEREWKQEEALFKSYVRDDEVLNKRIVIDQPNLNYNQRKRWIDLAKKEGYEVFAIHFNLSVEHCLHLIRFRNFYFDSNRSMPTQNEMMKQSLSFQKPGYDEGFNTIYVLDFLEDFNDSPSKENQPYYYHFLYDKP